MANEIRVRQNNTTGTLSAGVDNVVTTLTSAEFVDLPVIDTTNHLILILDPLETAGTAEIVRVTAHAAATTTVTVERGYDGSIARSHLAATTWYHGAVASDYVSSEHTSSSRPSQPYEGQLIVENDTDAIAIYDGTTWNQQGIWQSYTPSNTNVTVGNGTQTAKFCRIGDVIFWEYHLEFGTTTSFGGTVQIGLPVAAPAPATGTARGVVSFREAGISVQPGVAEDVNSGAAVYAVHHELTNVGRTNATAPFTWGTGDTLSISGSYEAA